MSRRFFVTTGPQLDIYFRDTSEVPVDFSAPATWVQMDTAAAITLEDPYTVEGSVDTWIDGLRTYSTAQGAELTQVRFVR
jgi:N-formylglutamate amidohydrolase